MQLFFSVQMQLVVVNWFSEDPFIINTKITVDLYYTFSKFRIFNSINLIIYNIKMGNNQPVYDEGMYIRPTKINKPHRQYMPRTNY